MPSPVLSNLLLCCAGCAVLYFYGVCCGVTQVRTRGLSVETAFVELAINRVDGVERALVVYHVQHPGRHPLPGCLHPPKGGGPWGVGAVLPPRGPGGQGWGWGEGEAGEGEGGDGAGGEGRAGSLPPPTSSLLPSWWCAPQSSTGPPGAYRQNQVPASPCRSLLSCPRTVAGTGGGQGVQGERGGVAWDQDGSPWRVQRSRRWQ